MRLRLLCVLLLSGLSSAAFAASVFRTRPDDPKAVTVTGAHANGAADDSAAVQRAIDQAAGTASEGLVFVPSGRYLLTRTVYVWPGVRVIGFGERRPVFLLADQTPGFQQGVADMIIFTGSRRNDPRLSNTRVPFPPQGSVPPDRAIADANSSTFYSAMSNIDFEIGAGNPAAIAIRFHTAQHAYLSHMNFHVGSGLAALTQVGNEAEDLHIFGGRYGILTEKTSAAWQFTLIDSTFEGQRESAIREHEVGLTLIRDTFRNLPAAIAIDPQYYDQLWVKDSRFEDITGSVVTISSEKSSSERDRIRERNAQPCPHLRAVSRKRKEDSPEKVTSTR